MIIKNQQLRIVLVQPGRGPLEHQILNTKEAAIQLVGGLLACARWRGYLTVCSEEKAPLGLQKNLDDFQGTFFIVATDGPDFRSLTANEVEDVLEALAHMR